MLETTLRTVRVTPPQLIEALARLIDDNPEHPETVETKAAEFVRRFGNEDLTVSGLIECARDESAHLFGGRE
jgi:hypothetical protein